jgi:hypothetical protein
MMSDREVAEELVNRVHARSARFKKWSELDWKDQEMAIHQVQDARELLAPTSSLTPDEQKVLADIRAATPEGYRVIGVRPGRTGEQVSDQAGNSSFRAYTLSCNCERPDIILAPPLPEPKPCPVCGSKAIRTFGVGKPTGCWQSRCACGITGPYAGSQEQAIALWNRLTLAPEASK